MDESLPVIYLNNSTTKTRQIFSLLHELAHLLLSINGLSKFDTDYIARLPESEKQLEIFCNAIAAEILIPGRDFTIQAERFLQTLKQHLKHCYRTWQDAMVSAGKLSCGVFLIWEESQEFSTKIKPCADLHKSNRRGVATGTLIKAHI